jgi:hypothetical protein
MLKAFVTFYFAFDNCKFAPAKSPAHVKKGSLKEPFIIILAKRGAEVIPYSHRPS